MTESDFVRAITGQWDHASLPANIDVGDGCFLESKASFERFRSSRAPGLVLGARVAVYCWTIFNVEPTGHVRVGDDSILVGATIMCQQEIRIGARCVLSYQVTIADSDFHPHDAQERIADARANAPSGDRSRRPPILARPVVIGDDVWIGIGTIILKGVTIGRGARIEPGSVIVRDVPAGATVAGNPGSVVGTGA